MPSVWKATIKSESARLLRVDAGSRPERHLETVLMTGGDPSEKGIRMGPHAPGWTQVPGGHPCRDAEANSAPGQRDDL